MTLSLLVSNGQLQNFNHNGINRQYIYYEPPNLPLNVPLVVVLHGYTSSANGIKKSYAVNMKEIRSSEPTQIPSVKAIFDMARNGDKRCQEILNFTFEKLGQKMADFIHVLNPEAIIFCGNIAKSLQSYLPVISEFCEEQLLDDFKGKVYYGISELLDNKMNVLGPASLALTKSEEHVC